MPQKVYFLEPKMSLQAFGEMPEMMLIVNGGVRTRNVAPAMFSWTPTSQFLIMLEPHRYTQFFCSARKTRSSCV